jgi:hypothetical protein
MAWACRAGTLAPRARSAPGGSPGPLLAGLRRHQRRADAYLLTPRLCGHALELPLEVGCRVTDWNRTCGRDVLVSVT